MLKYIIIIFLLIFSFNSFSQQKYPLSRQDSALIIKNLNEYENENNLGRLKEASEKLNTTAMIYWEHNYFDEATKYYEQSLSINEILGNENAIAMINSNIALINTDMENYPKALIYFEKTLATRVANKETIGIIAALINMSVVYNNLKKYEEALTSLNKALDYAREMNDPEQMRSCYGMLAETYEKKGDTKNSLYYFEYYKSFHELVQKQRIAKVGEELETEKLKTLLFAEESEKKELQLLLTESELKNKKNELLETDSTNKSLVRNLTRQELESEFFKKEKYIESILIRQKIQKKQKIIIIVLIIAISLTIILLIFIYANFNKKINNKKLLYQNQQIVLQQQEIIFQNTEIEKINNQLTASINYAKFIQESTLNKKSILNTFVKDSFIYYKPRDIVSGDFYWFDKIDNKIVIAAVDCTGHGVPGGFLSMIGNELMNKIILFDKITNPTEILKYMDIGISNTLNQENSKNTDGMDMSLVTIDYEHNFISFAGANNPLVLIQNDELTIAKGTKISIGGHRIKSKEYQNLYFSIKENTFLYLFSDGYLDQLGGDKGRSIGTKRFANFIFENHKIPMNEQINIFEENFNNWRNQETQIDDVLIIGVKL